MPEIRVDSKREHKHNRWPELLTAVSQLLPSGQQAQLPPGATFQDDFEQELRGLLEMQISGAAGDGRELTGLPSAPSIYLSSHSSLTVGRGPTECQ